ncbi:MAG: acylneuraminate cytidylyltransferase family protein [Deltaproteobacteria bacterium]|nr:acylneuraminate cytidylyltransferase family protein [Deltaproteobacteria bacterium]MBW2642146.1 acylneuraminate cytidylyltransferase family protein [Deltaproteobacteria bacterium]
MLENKTILVVVPARGGSKGIILKNIVKLNGVPLVALVGRVVKKIPYVDRAVVSTDNEKIAQIAGESGLDAPFMRPEALSGDFVSDWEVLNHALLECERIDGRYYDIVVMLQPTSPFRQPEHVTATVKKIIRSGYDAVWTVSETDAKAHPLKQLVILDESLDYYDPAGAAVIARQQLNPVYHRNGVAYAMTRDCIINKKNIKGDRTSFVLIDEDMANIDTEFDLKFAEFILNTAENADQK